MDQLALRMCLQPLHDLLHLLLMFCRHRGSLLFRLGLKVLINVLLQLGAEPDQRVNVWVRDSEGTRLFGEAQGDSRAAVLHIQELSTDLQENEALMICRLVGLLLLLEVLDGILDLHAQRNSD